MVLLHLCLYAVISGAQLLISFLIAGAKVLGKQTVGGRPEHERLCPFCHFEAWRAAAFTVSQSDILFKYVCAEVATSA